MNKTISLMVLTLAAAFLWSSVAANCLPAKSSAQLTETKGEVFKCGFLDWNKHEWGEPQPARTGDVLTEGMQLATGNQSWAQLSWKYITTRAWENSVYAIAPNQRLVYLIGGEMLYSLDKKRKTKGQYHVWTKFLQARVRGTTILVQSTKKLSRLTVLEGKVNVLNRLDGSVVELKPGLVYEVKLKGKATDSESQEAGGLLSEQNTQSPSKATAGSNTQVGAIFNGQGLETDLLPIDVQTIAPVQLFETAQAITSLYAIDTNELIGHPLLQSFSSPLSSLPLITKSISELPTLPPSLDLPTGVMQKGDLPEAVSGIFASVKIVRVPTRLAYQLGPLVGQLVPVPAAGLQHWPPVGIIGQVTKQNLQAGLHSLHRSKFEAGGSAVSSNTTRQVLNTPFNGSLNGSQPGVGGLTGGGALPGVGGLTGGGALPGVGGLTGGGALPGVGGLP